MMKIKCKKILWVRLLMYSLVMGIGIFLVRQKWNEQARVIFKTALLQELQKRDTLSISYISNWKATPALEEVNPGTVEIELDSGKRKYEIPCFKFENSLVKGGIQRGLLTALLDESPLDADSLHGTWNKLLKESDIFLKTHTRITVWDFQEQPSSAFSKNVQKFSQTDSLLSYYMGFRCEVEATGYASCEWWWLFSDWRLLAIGGVCAGIELLFFIFGKMYCYRKNRQPEEVEQEGLPVIVVTVEQSPVYQLGEHTFFDAERMELIKPLGRFVTAYKNRHILGNQASRRQDGTGRRITAQGNHDRFGAGNAGNVEDTRVCGIAEQIFPLVALRFLQAVDVRINNKE